MRRPETREQIALVRTLTMAGVPFFAVPNGELRASHTAALLSQMGVRTGAPDLLIVGPPLSRPLPLGVALELKALKAEGGRPPRPDQVVWLERFKTAGWAAVVAYGAEDAERQLEALGYSTAPLKGKDPPLEPAEPGSLLEQLRLSGGRRRGR